MASKRVTKVNREKASDAAAANSSVRYYVDPDQSMNELFQQPGQAPSQGAGRFERKPLKTRPFPHSYFQQPRTQRHRGSSASHSPQGSTTAFSESSDDGFSTSRNTLSPPFGQVAPLPFHKKQFSAPELEDRHSELYAPCPALPATTAPPPQLHSQSYSKSVPAIDAASSHEMASFVPAPHHVRSVSYDPVHQGQPFAVFPTHSQQLHSSLAQPQLRAKSASLDPMVAPLEVPPQALPASLQPQPAFDSALDGLPPGWSAAYTPGGDVYFMDHVNKVTTWYDPRLPHHVQEERVRARHGVASSSHEAVLSPPSDSMQSPAPGPHAYPQAAFDSSQGFTTRMQEYNKEQAEMKERQKQLRDMGYVNSPGMYDAASPLGNNNMSHAAMYYGQQPMEMEYSGGHPAFGDMAGALNVDPNEMEVYLQNVSIQDRHHIPHQQPQPIQRFQ